MMLLPLANLTLWTTPIWFISVGVTLGALVLAILWGLLWLVNLKRAEEVVSLVSEGILMPITYLIGALIVLCLLAAPQMPVRLTWESLQRLTSVGEASRTVEVPAKSDDFSVPVAFSSDELTHYDVASDQDVRIAAEKGVGFTAPIAVVRGDEKFTWTPKSKLPRGFQGNVNEVFITNVGDAPAKVTFTYGSDVRMPQAHHIPIVTLFTVGLFVLYLGIAWLAPGISNIALATAKEAIGQPLFLIFIALGSVAFVIFIYVPYNTFGEDVKMLKDSGLSTILVLSIIFGLWTASTSVADEIEGKTALTVLSKPISRRQFILGKYLGILWPILLMTVILGAVLLTAISYKMVYDSRETSNPTPEWQQCYAEVAQTSPGLLLGFFEAAVMTAISVAISTRLPMLPNLIICGAIYVIGHLTPLIVQSSVGKNEFVQFFGKLLAVISPMLDNLNIQAAIAGGKTVPWDYIGLAGLYSAICIAIALLVALILFEDRDLA